jgi:hypothetical protein
MVTHMKTTIEIADSLLDEARELAAGENTTLRALVEAGLRQVISERKCQPPFRLRDTSFCGNGLQPEFRDADWEQIRQAAYEDRGG